ncbi:Abi-alpha family protein [Pedobacter sp. WC2501]|uniref:Abi-alpha family protein n=1 Tax=Pedobacter sp. WC2501 TaxID=3461400 RepID=UPI004045EA09
MAKDKINKQVNNKIKVDLDGFDPLGMKAVGETLSDSIEGTSKLGLKAAKQFLSLTCKPLFEEFGLIMRDKLSTYRLNNIVKVLEKAEGKLTFDLTTETLKINPRIAYQIIENASLVDDNDLQEMWAGLFAASCNKDDDDENIIFIDILKQLTGSQVKLLNFICQNTKKWIEFSNLPEAIKRGTIRQVLFVIHLHDAMTVMGTENFAKVSNQVSALFNIGLLTVPTQRPYNTSNPFEKNTKISAIPSLILLQLFVKGQGSNDTPLEYFSPVVKSEIKSKIGHYIEFDPDSILNFLYEKNRLVAKHQILYSSTTLFAKRASLANLSSVELNELFQALALINYDKFDFEKNYEVVDNGQLLGSFHFEQGFRKSAAF